MELTTTQINEISQIILNWLTIFGLIFTFLKQRGSTREGTLNLSTTTGFFKIVWLYCLLSFMCIGAVLYIVLSESPLTKLTVVAIASCLASLAFLIVAISYKYILWSSINNLKNYRK